MKILAIGNSFSMDATEHHLRGLANTEGAVIVIANLYISGASLQLHWVNAQKDSAAYQYRKINEQGVMEVTHDVTLYEALIDESWDYISFQQASSASGLYNTYVEPLPLLFNYVDSVVPSGTKFIFHQTWAYAQDATNPGFANYNNNQLEMYNAIVDAASQAYNLVDFDVFVPAGTAIQNGRTSMAGDHFTRDGYHLDDKLGRYTAACTWFEAVFQQSVIGNVYRPEGVSEYQAEIAQQAAHLAVTSPYEVTILEDYVVDSVAPLSNSILIDFGRNSPAIGWNQIQTSSPPHVNFQFNGQL